MNDNNLSFTGIWIPASVWLDETLNATERCLLGAIITLSATKKGCLASNDWFAKLFGTTPATIAVYISRFRQKGLIRDLEFNGKSRKIKGYATPENDLIDAINRPKKPETRGRPKASSIKPGLNAEQPEHLTPVKCCIEPQLNAEPPAYKDESIDQTPIPPKVEVAPPAGRKQRVPKPPVILTPGTAEVIGRVRRSHLEILGEPLQFCKRKDPPIVSDLLEQGFTPEIIAQTADTLWRKKKDGQDGYWIPGVASLKVFAEHFGQIKNEVINGVKKPNGKPARFIPTL